MSVKSNSKIWSTEHFRTIDVYEFDLKNLNDSWYNIERYNKTIIININKSLHSAIFHAIKCQQSLSGQKFEL